MEDHAGGPGSVSQQQLECFHGRDEPIRAGHPREAHVQDAAGRCLGR